MPLAVPEEAKPFDEEFQVALVNCTSVATGHQENDVTTMYRAYMQRVLTVEGGIRPHRWLTFSAPFVMGPDSRELPDLAAKVSIHGRNCDPARGFAAFIHESKPHFKRASYVDENRIQQWHRQLYIDSPGLCEDAGRQTLSRLKDQSHWVVVQAMRWNDVYGSAGIGPYCCVMVRRTNNGRVYRLSEGEEGEDVFREQRIVEIPACAGYIFNADQFMHVNGPTFAKLYTAAGAHILDQLHQRKQNAQP